MKLQFKNQDFQTDAVNAVVDLFAGQERTHSTFSVEVGGQMDLIAGLGFGNVLRIDDETIARNMRAVQKRTNLPLTDDTAPRQICIEMETGTGKTYVYTKTIFELNRRSGFTKFIIVVPSVPTREGVYKSLQVTQEHFGAQYDSVPCRYFIYNSAKLSDVREYPTSTGPVDYALFVGGIPVGVVEAEKDTEGQDLTKAEMQSERYTTSFSISKKACLPGCSPTGISISWPKR